MRILNNCSLFYLNVLGDEFSYMKLQTQISHILSFKRSTFERNDAGDDIGLLIVSGRAMDQGTILFVNNKVCMALKQKKETLVESRLRSILPFCVAENYQTLWRRFYKRGEASFIEKK